MARATHARTRAAHERAFHALDLDREFIVGFHRTWADIEAQITALNDTKKAMLGKVRATFGRHQAETLKETMRLMAMAPERRAERGIIDAMARRYVDILDNIVELKEAA